MIKIFTLGILPILLVLSSCSKDKRIEKKMDGEWKIESYSYDVVAQTVPSQTIFSGSTANAGTFTFNNDNTGSYSYTIADTITRSGSFKWTVDDSKLSITYLNQVVSLSPTYVYQYVGAYSSDISKPGTDEVTLQGSDTRQVVSGSSASVYQMVITGNIRLKRK